MTLYSVYSYDTPHHTSLTMVSENCVTPPPYYHFSSLKRHTSIYYCIPHNTPPHPRNSPPFSLVIELYVASKCEEGMQYEPYLLLASGDKLASKPLSYLTTTVTVTRERYTSTTSAIKRKNITLRLEYIL